MKRHGTLGLQEQILLLGTQRDLLYHSDVLDDFFMKPFCMNVTSTAQRSLLSPYLLLSSHGILLLSITFSLSLVSVNTSFEKKELSAENRERKAMSDPTQLPQDTAQTLTVGTDRNSASARFFRIPM